MILWVLFSGQAAAQATSAIPFEGPTEVVGDGKTAFGLRVTLDQASAPETDAVQVNVSAGRVVSRKTLGPGVLELVLLPPRVVESIVMSVQLSPRRGQRREMAIRLLPSIATAKVRSSNGPLDLRVPERLVLGHDAQGTVTFRRASSSPVTLYASAGTVTVAQPDQDNRYKSIYTPPADKLPRVVVIVAASDDGTLLDWAPILLFGRPLVTTTSEQRATVLARIGGEDFGPITANWRGRVEVRVLAPPGVNAAEMLVRDALGNERNLSLKLGVPAARASFAVCPPASEGLFLFAVNAVGEPRRGLDVRVEASHGTPAAPQLSTQGYYWSSLALPANAELGQSFELQARILGEADSRVSCQMAVVGEAPNHIQLSVIPSTWTAGIGEPLQVIARASFAGLRKSRVVPLHITAEFGELSPFLAQSTEVYASLWRIPANLNGRSRAKLTVRTASAVPVQDELTLELRAGPPAQLQLEAEDYQLKADGYSTTQLIARVLDAYGNPVNAHLRVIAAAGRVSDFAATSPGNYKATYQAPAFASQTYDEVSIGAEGTQATARVRVNLLPTSIRFRLWGGFGYSTNFGKLEAPLGTIGGSIRLPWLSEHLVVGVDVAYLASRYSERDATDLEIVTLETTVVPISASALYELSRSRLRPYLGVGVGVAMVKLGLSSPSSGSSVGWNAQLVYTGIAGALFRLGPGSVRLECDYRHVGIDEPLVTGNVGGLSATGGYAYEF